jgi:uncharacterized protein YdcH (DUF465 family)
MPVVAVPRALRERWGEEGSEDLARLPSSLEEAARENALVMAEERFERRLAETEARIDHRITETEAKLDKRITEVEAKLDKRITAEIAGLKADMSALKAEIIKWMFLFWLGQLMAVAGLLELLH